MIALFDQLLSLQGAGGVGAVQQGTRQGPAEAEVVSCPWGTGQRRVGGLGPLAQVRWGALVWCFSKICWAVGREHVML